MRLFWGRIPTPPRAPQPGPPPRTRPHKRDKIRPARLHPHPQNARRLPRLKPMTPRRVDHCHEMKPLTPLLPQNSQFLDIFRPQRRRRFHAPLTEHPQRRRWFIRRLIRAAASQQGAQTLMLAASAVALIAPGSSTVRRCHEIEEAPARCPHRCGPHPPAVLPGLG